MRCGYLTAIVHVEEWHNVVLSTLLLSCVRYTVRCAVFGAVCAGEHHFCFLLRLTDQTVTFPFDCVIIFT